MATKINASHILVKTEEEAKSILADLNNGKSFEELAKLKSTCPSGKNGGVLGWFTHGQMVKEFEKAAFNMKKGQISQPVKTQFGYHIIKVNDTWG
jgi:peptidyl-prolyl cis-trans isomerase C